MRLVSGSSLVDNRYRTAGMFGSGNVWRRESLATLVNHP